MRRLLRGAEVSVVPHVCPDGAIHGNLRSNAAGINLNREWQEPSMERSPEVVRESEYDNVAFKRPTSLLN